MTGPEIMPSEAQGLTDNRAKANLVNLDRVTKNLPVIESPYRQLEQNKGKVLGFIRGERIQSKEQGFDTPFTHTYKEYLAALRSVRLEQREYEEGEDNSQERTEYYDPEREYPASRLKKKDIQYSPVVARRLLENFNQKDIDPEEIARIIKDPTIFYKKVKKIIEERPDVMLSNILALQTMFVEEYMQNRVQKIKSQDYQKIIEHFDEAAGYFSPEEQKDIINQMLHDDRADKILTYLHRPSIAAFFTPEELRKNIDIAVAHRWYPLTPDLLDPYIENGTLTAEDIKGIINKRIENLSTLQEFSTLLKYFTPEEITVLRQKTLDTFLQDTSGDSYISNLDLDDSFLSREENRLIAQKSILTDPIGTAYRSEALTKIFEADELKSLFLQALDDTQLTRYHGVDTAYSFSCLMKVQFLTDKEKQSLVQRTIDLKHTDFLLDYLKLYLNVFPKEDQSTMANNIVKSASLDVVVAKLETLVQYLSAKEIQELSETALRSSEISVTDSFINDFYHVSKVLSPEETFTLLEFGATQPAASYSILLNVDWLLSYVPEDKQDAFVRSLIAANPPLALGQILEKPDVFTKLNIDKQTIFDIAFANTRDLQFAPKSLQALYKNLSRETTEENFRNLVIEGSLLYVNMHVIMSNGLEDKFIASLKAQQLTVSQEKELLLAYNNLIKMSHDFKDDFGDDDCFGLSYEATRSKLFSKFSKLLGQESEYTPDEISRFMGTMDSPIPLLTYTLQYYKSPEHQAILHDIFQSILKGTYPEWKYGPADIEFFQELKEEKLLPTNLTFDQYITWQSDEQTSFFDSLATDTATIAKNIQEYMSNNIEHLQITPVLDEVMGKYPDISVGVQATLGEIGQELASINKALNTLRKSENPDQKEVQELEDKKVSLEVKRQRYVRARKILRLMNIRPEEIAAGCLLEGKEAKSKGDQLDKLIDDLKRTSLDDNSFIYETVVTFINDLRNQTGERQNVVCTDSSNPKVMIEIGNTPVGSCQDYEHGSMNKCLLGYSEPNTKIMVVRNEKGAIIARSIFRILESKDGNPALHLERIYSASTSDAINKIMYTHAMKKSQPLGVPLFVSSQSQNENGILIQASVPAGFKAEMTKEILSVKAARAPYVYVDSAGGENSYDGYTMEDLQEITRQ